METLGNFLVAKNGNKMANKYICDKCDYKCYKKYNWDNVGQFVKSMLYILLTKKIPKYFLYKIIFMLTKLCSGPKSEKPKIRALSCKTRFEN